VEIGSQNLHHQQSPKSDRLTTEQIKRKTPSLNNSERTWLLEVLRFNDLVHHVDGHSMKKFKPLAQTYPDSRIIWTFEITERGQTYLAAGVDPSTVETPQGITNGEVSA